MDVIDLVHPLTAAEKERILSVLDVPGELGAWVTTPEGIPVYEPSESERFAAQADYIVVETACEECGVVNDHLTTHCPFVERVDAIAPQPLHVALPLLLAMPMGAVWIPRN